jgi:hypothetical protein
MPLHDEQCLTLYEQGAARHSIDRALLLVSTVGDVEADAGDWADQPLGRRDARLLALRCAWFGPQFDAVLACPACHELRAVALDLRGFVSAEAETDDSGGTVQVAGRRLRRPTSRDLAAIAGAPDVDQASLQLLDRLALDPAPAGGWSAADIEAAEAALDSADPLAHVTIALRCEGCGHGWQAPLDIAEVLWDELSAQARSVVAEVHLLASAYGWSEGEILSMPAARRRLYLQQVGS